VKKNLIKSIVALIFMILLSGAAMAQGDSSASLFEAPYEKDPDAKHVVEWLNQFVKKLDGAYRVSYTKKIKTKKYSSETTYNISFADKDNYKIEVVDLSGAQPTDVFVTNNGQSFKNGEKTVANLNSYFEILNEIKNKIMRPVLKIMGGNYKISKKSSQNDIYEITSTFKGEEARKLVLTEDLKTGNILKSEEYGKSFNDIATMVMAALAPENPDDFSNPSITIEFSGWEFLSDPKKIDLSYAPPKPLKTMPNNLNAAKEPVCEKNMKTIYGAIELYSMESASMKDLSIESLVKGQYLKSVPMCPKNGVYKLITHANKNMVPVCSVHGGLN